MFSDRLFELRNQFIALEMLICIPTNLAGDEHNAARCHADPVRITDRRRPARWMEDLHGDHPTVLQRTLCKVPRTALRSSAASARSLATSFTTTCEDSTVTPTDLNLANARDSDSGVNPS